MVQHHAWGTDKKAGLNSVSSPELGVIMMTCPALPAPPRRALLMVEGGVGADGAKEVCLQ